MRVRVKKFHCFHLLFIKYQNRLFAFSLPKQAQRKSFSKRNAVFCANAAQASAFEKAEQNNSFSSCEQSAR
jgi:hypothetical protein